MARPYETLIGRTAGVTDIDEASVHDRLRVVEDPGLGDDIVSFGLMDAVEVDGDTVRISLVLSVPCPPAETDIGRRIREVSVGDGLEIDLAAKVPADHDPDEEVLPGVKNTIAVVSGKGGVGKSTVVVNLTAGPSKLGAHVGLFSADIYGPNAPRIIAAEEMPQATQDQTTVPPEKYRMKLIPMAFLIGDDDPVIWRGPVVHQLLAQLVEDVGWGSLDYLVLDLPSGTGDTRLSIPQTPPFMGVVIVTTPQNVAFDGANKGPRMFSKHDTDVLGIVENMSTFQCSDCGNRHDIFSADGGRESAASNGLSFLGAFSPDPAVREDGDGGKPVVLEDGDETADAFRVMIENIADIVGTVQRQGVNER